MCPAVVRAERWRRRVVVLVGLFAASCTLIVGAAALADGMAVAPSHYKGVPYEGSVEERAQEAIIIFEASREPGGAREDVILRISVEGEVENFAWVVPFPNQPEVAKEDARLFDELYEYVEARLVRPVKKYGGGTDSEAAAPTAEAPQAVEVLSRKIVGTFDVAVVRENQPGALNGWLEREGYQPLRDAEDVLDFYRQKKYVYACVKVSDAQLSRNTPVDLHPLRFSFKTGGRDGMYFPMKMTGLQQRPFDVNLYVFYGKWVNDRLSKFGYEHRGFQRKYRDWDTRQCEPNAGKSYSAPQHDVFLSDHAHRVPTVTKLFQKLHPGQRYYLTNIQAWGLKPEAVRNWSDDLWLFPYYTDRSFVPFDARPGGPASAAWPNSYPATKGKPSKVGSTARPSASRGWFLPTLGSGIGVLVGVAIGIGVGYMRRAPAGGSKPESASDAAAPPGHGPI